MNNISYNYEEIFQRNKGVFSVEQLSKLKKLRVAIAGAGGLGGPAAFFLARLGVRKIKIADPETFEVTNINRQFGSNLNSVGKNKAQVIAEQLKNINPYLELEVFENGINQVNVNGFLEEVDVAIDGIDFFSVDLAKIFYQVARKKRIWVFTSQAAINILSFISFNPCGKSFDDIFCIKDEPSLKKIIRFCFPVLPEGITEGDVDKFLEKKETHISSHSTPPAIGGGILVEELLNVIIRKKAPMYEAPNLMLLDLEKMFIYHYKNGKKLNE
ncbi:MAG: ThiF family adenylyltransferase [Patescibacteria group bacterium]|jgi:hypothetical protein